MGSTTGDDSKIETVEASYDVANHEVAQRLGIGRGDRVVHRVRRYYKGRHIVLLHDQWLPRRGSGCPRVRRYYKGRHIVLLHDQWLQAR
ncbi:hypothetical protein Ae717Ps2_5939 [Pseudonocardia sp. Ae717_Ps2]|uniref:UTRA domain-containing protein n=1 Tax=Pseudonocardia sp. Ae717_Ps2 TaxID=1885573 RepID=UPI0009690761|nr:UTRA domain-containing protein [Pseudonocardia sp. Ae717_Ps2]OLM28820.1 hypothetical protein Ae717Ps2_5939 [Pseudonocardia sp. Ae717_Ps2]